MSIVVKKRVSLDSLGEEYKDGYLNFSSIPFKDYDKMAKEVDELAKQDADKNTSSSLDYIKKQLLDRFIEGKFVDADGETPVTKDNLFELPGDALVDAFQQLLGKVSPNS